MPVPARRDSDFQLVSAETEFAEEDRQPTAHEVPGVVHRLTMAFRAHRVNHSIDDEKREIEEREYRKEIEIRIRALEDAKLQQTTQILTAGAVVGIVFTTAVTLIGLLSGILKWNL